MRQNSVFFVSSILAIKSINIPLIHETRGACVKLYKQRVLFLSNSFYLILNFMNYMRSNTLNLRIFLLFYSDLEQNIVALCLINNFVYRLLRVVVIKKVSNTTWKVRAIARKNSSI